MSDVHLNDTRYHRFCTIDATGAAVDADSLPTVDVEEDGGTAGAFGCTVTDVGVGKYRVTIPVTAANGYDVGKRYSVMVTAVVGGKTSYTEICEFYVLEQPGTPGTIASEVFNYISAMVPLMGTPVGIRKLYVAADNTTSAVVRENTATAGAAGTITLDASASATNDLYNGNTIRIISGTGAGQTRRIRDYVGSSKVATITPNWSVNPDATSVFVIDADAGAIEDNGVVATSIATAAITNAKFAAGAIDAASIAASALTAAKFATDGLDLFGFLRRNTATGGAATTITLDAGASPEDNRYSNALLVIVGGVGVGQFRAIISYVGATKIATVDRAWDTNPDGTSVFVILANAPATGSVNANVTSTSAGAITRASFAQDAKDLFGEIRRNTATGGAASTITLDAAASATNDFYKNAIIVLVGGTGAGQFGQVSSYAGGTKIATMTLPWAVVPDATSVFEIFPESNAGTAAGIATSIFGTVLEGSHTFADLVRGIVSALVGKVSNFQTGTLVFKSINGAKTRWTVTTDQTGRLTLVVGDLT